MTSVVTHDTGGTGRPATAVCVQPERQLPMDVVPPALAETGLHAAFVVDLLSACLAHGRCGTHLYRSVAARTTDDTLRAQYELLGEQARQHVESLEQIVAASGGDPQYVSAAARATEHAAAALLESTFLLAGSVDAMTAETTMLEAVMQAEIKNSSNWEVLAQLASVMAVGSVRSHLSELTAEVLAPEDDPFTWAARTRARVLLALSGAELTPATERQDDEVLEELTRDELYARARALDIAGRSQMTKDELRDAVVEQDVTGS